MPVETKEVETPDTDIKAGAEGNDFSSAFNEATIGAIPDDKPAETPPEKEEGADKVEEKSEVEEKDKDTSESKPPEAGAKAEDKEEETYEALKHKHDTLKGMYEKDTKDLREKLKELETKVNTKQDTPKPEPKSRKQEVDELIAKVIENNPKVKGYFDEYDYAAEPLRELLGEVIAEAKSNGSSNDEAVTEVKRELHFMTIKMAHRDFDELIKPEGKDKPSKLETFVTSYTGSDKEKITNAFTNGNAWDVIELVDTYKKSLEAPASATVPDEVKERREKKLNDLAAVPKKDAAINANSKKKVSTFGDAFAEVAAK